MNVYILRQELEEYGEDLVFIASQEDLSDEEIKILLAEWQQEIDLRSKPWQEAYQANSALVQERKPAYYERQAESVKDMTDEELAEILPGGWGDVLKRDPGLRSVGIRVWADRRLIDLVGNDRYAWLELFDIDPSEERRLKEEYEESQRAYGPLRVVRPHMIDAESMPYTYGLVIDEIGTLKV